MSDLPSDLTITCSRGFEPTALRDRRTRGVRSSKPERGNPLPGLLTQGFELVGDPHRITKPGESAKRGVQAPAKVTAVARVAADEDALLLIDQDGVWTWHEPDERSPVRSTGRARRSIRDDAAVGREITFFLGTSETDPTRRVSSARRSGAADRSSRGLVHKVIRAGARLFVLKFVARKVTDHVMAHLEAGIATRLVHITGADPDRWQTLEPSFKAKGPRTLLFIHGMFSSTKGGFGNLDGHESGVAFIESALANYDVVLGFDHRTLSVDPLANAIDLLAMLRAMSGPLRRSSTSLHTAAAH